MFHLLFLLLSSQRLACPPAEEQNMNHTDETTPLCESHCMVPPHNEQVNSCAMRTPDRRHGMLHYGIDLSLKRALLSLDPSPVASSPLARFFWARLAEPALGALRGAPSPHPLPHGWPGPPGCCCCGCRDWRAASPRLLHIHPGSASSTYSLSVRVPQHTMASCQGTPWSWSVLHTYTLLLSLSATTGSDQWRGPDCPSASRSAAVRSG